MGLKRMSHENSYETLTLASSGLMRLVGDGWVIARCGSCGVDLAFRDGSSFVGQISSGNELVRILCVECAQQSAEAEPGT